jgi:hypothetical protein
VADPLSPQVWAEDWVVHAQAVGNGQAALKYLAPYIFRVAISNNRMAKVAEGQVTFRYTPSGSQKSKLCTLPAEEFIRRFLQHVLPKGFVKVYYDGLFSPGQRHRLKQASALLEAQRPADPPPELEPVSTEAADSPVQPPTRVCPQCGQPLGWPQKLKPAWRQPP